MSNDLRRGEPLLAPPYAWTDADPPAERVGEMALIGEADSERDLGKRLVSVPDQLLRATDAGVEMPAMRRNTRRTTECTCELGSGQTRKPGQYVHFDWVGQVSFDVVDHTVELPFCQPATNLCSGDRPMQLLHGEPPHFGRIIRLRREMVFFGARLNGAS